MTDTTPRAGGLGRRYAPDPRDRRFLMSAERLHEIPRQLEPGVRRRTFPWKRGPVLDQGSTSECTVYAAAAFLMCAPQLHSKGLGWDPQQFTSYYHQAQAADEFQDTPPADGTSERAVQKVLQDAGFVSEYLWVTDEDIAREYLLTRGPLLLGTEWFSGMDSPGKDAMVEASGQSRGGHEVCVRWYYNSTHAKYPDTYELINSWGESYGDKGLFRIKAEGFRYLFLHLNGDLCSPQEAKRAKK